MRFNSLLKVLALSWLVIAEAAVAEISEDEVRRYACGGVFDGERVSELPMEISASFISLGGFIQERALHFEESSAFVCPLPQMCYEVLDISAVFTGFMTSMRASDIDVLVVATQHKRPETLRVHRFKKLGTQVSNDELVCQ